jgi:hypothetical protein
MCGGRISYTVELVMPEGTVNYRIFAALETHAAFDMFQSYGLFDEPLGQEELELDEDSYHQLDELDF